MYVDLLEQLQWRVTKMITGLEQLCYEAAFQYLERGCTKAGEGLFEGACDKGSLLSVSELAPEKREDVIHAEMDERLSLRKHRFMHFASLEYEGEYYMTPRDFLFSVMFDQVERKASAKKLTKKEVDASLLYVAKAKPGPTFFRDLGDKGLISYAEYLFLLTILTKPQTGLQIAFKMLDTDGNERVEKKEFFKETELEDCGVNTMLLVHFFGKEGKQKLRYSEFFRWHKENGNCLHLFSKTIAKTATKEAPLHSLLSSRTPILFCRPDRTWVRHYSQRYRLSQSLLCLPAKYKPHIPDTIYSLTVVATLKMKPSGPSQSVLTDSMPDLHSRFMENLQTEVQEMEFIKFSKGLNVMRKEDFAAWLLYFTDEENNEIYWQNVKDRIEAGENISLEEFKTFCKFTNNLEDFSIAMQMFTVANRPVKRAEFKRAVKVATGQELSDNVLDTIFKIFDLDGDDCLSHSEFLGVLRNRIHRGLRVPQQQGIQGYWKCVKRESIKGAKEVWKQTGKSPF
ncbi:hypothetical protein WISP_63661 [Willisornis vidua]|uniref:EF-hand domain-containing protein n=1 Tax=Willisornis vidua TaxID=1566151 RepID=A0ABQ9DEU5_9PASS|nr:hypothetical protein WISP_63661 [Willisornis vidua]